MTKRLWKLHSWLGLLTGLGLLLIGLTGSALVFAEELDGLFSAQETRVQPTAEGRQSWDKLLAGAQQEWPDYDITGFGPRASAHTADLVYLKERGGHEYRVGTLNPYTATRQSEPFDSSQTLTGILLELHYTWFAEHYGMLITGIFGALLCVLGLTGVWLYRGFWKSFFTLRWGRSARIFFSDLHKMVGISSVAFNLILGFTGAYWNITHILREGLAEHEEETKSAGPYFAKTISLDALSKAAAEKLPGFEARWISFPSSRSTPPSAEEVITLWGRLPGQNFLASDYGSMVSFDPETGALKSAVSLQEAGWWMNFTDTFRALHYGTFGGLPVKILWSILGLAPGILAVSGFLIWRSRHQAQKKDRVGGQPSAVSR